MDMRVIKVTDFKLEVRFDLWDNLESNIGKLPLQVMRGSPLVNTSADGGSILWESSCDMATLPATTLEM